MNETIAAILIHTIGGGAGVLIAGRIFGCILTPGKAIAAATISALVYAFLTVQPGIGGVISFAVLLGLVGLWGTGDWMDAFLTSSIAKGIVLIVTLLWAVSSTSPTATP